MSLSDRKPNTAFLIEGMSSQFYEKMDAKKADQIVYQEHPEIEWAVNIAQANHCKMFDPITQAFNIAINELYEEANEKDKIDENKNNLAKTVYILGFFLGPGTPLHSLTLLLSPSESNKAKMPAWLNNLTFQDLKNLPKQHGFEMTIEDYIELIKKFTAKHNEIAQRNFIRYLTDNPEVNVVYGLIGKNHLSMLSEHSTVVIEESIADDHRLIKLTVNNREVEVHLFGGQHSSFSTCRHLAEFLKTKGMPAPDAPADKEKELFSQTWGRMARFYNEITPLTQHHFYQLAMLEHAAFFEMDFADVIQFILLNAMRVDYKNDISDQLIEKLIPLIENKLKAIDDKDIAKNQKDLILKKLQELKQKFNYLKYDFHALHINRDHYAPIFNAILDIMKAIQLHATAEKSQTLKEMLKQVNADLLEDTTNDPNYSSREAKAQILSIRHPLTLPEEKFIPLVLMQEYLGYLTDEQAAYVVQPDKQSSDEAKPSATGIFATAAELSNAKLNKDPAPADNDVKATKKL